MNHGSTELEVCMDANKIKVPIVVRIEMKSLSWKKTGAVLRNV